MFGRKFFSHCGLGHREFDVLLEAAHYMTWVEQLHGPCHLERWVNVCLLKSVNADDVHQELLDSGLMTGW